MRVVAVLGSPRVGGNSSSLAKIIIDQALAEGDSVDVFHLNKLTYRGCQGCSACKGNSEICVLRDDLTDVLKAVAESDILLLATPVYWGEISGQLKMFIDRTYSYLKPDFKDRPDKHRLPPGKRLVWIETQGAENEDLFADIFPRYNNFFSQLNYFTETYLLRGCGMATGVTIDQRPDLVDQAETIAAKLYGKTIGD